MENRSTRAMRIFEHDLRRGNAYANLLSLTLSLCLHFGAIARRVLSRKTRDPTRLSCATQLRTRFVVPRGERREVGQGTRVCWMPNSEPAHSVQVQAPPFCEPALR